MYNVAVIEDDLEMGALIAKTIKKIDLPVLVSLYEGPVSFQQSKDLADIILLDVLMPEMNGLEAIPMLKKSHSNALIIMHTIKNDADMIFKAIKAGAVGYIDKQSSGIDYLTVFESVLRGGAYLTPSVAFKVVHFFQRNSSKFNSLTTREKEITHYIMEAKSYNAIAKELNISVNTVRMHIKNIYGKLQVHSKFELINLNKIQ